MFSVLARDQKGRSLTLRVAANDVWQMSLEKGEWSPIYGVALPIPVVRFRCKARLPVELLTVLLPEDLDIELSQPDALRASVYDLLLSEVSYRFVFGSGHWRVGELSGNEEFALFCANRPDEYRMIGSVAKPAPSSNGRL